MLVVVALGGNALLRRGEPMDAETQRKNVKLASAAIAELAAEHQVVVTHGNGPQVGLLALQSEEYLEARPYPLDVLGAESAGMIGYMLEQELVNALPAREITTVLTQVVVDANDAAFSDPTKPIGPAYEKAEAQRLANERGWVVAADGDVWRRMVPSPEPLEIVELDTIELLVDAGIVVICAGGGGIPVVFDDSGGVRGIEAVIDKDRAAALLARELAADALVMLTDVPAVYAEYGTPQQRAVRRVSPEMLSRMEFAAGSMGPKVEAASWFARSTGCAAYIGALPDAMAVLREEAGTTISEADGSDLTFWS